MIQGLGYWSNATRASSHFCVKTHFFASRLRMRAAIFCVKTHFLRQDYACEQPIFASRRIRAPDRWGGLEARCPSPTTSCCPASSPGCTSPRRRSRPGIDVMILEIFSAKKNRRKKYVFDAKHCWILQKVDHTYATLFLTKIMTWNIEKYVEYIEYISWLFLLSHLQTLAQC
jgi:hypothetical protein